MPKKPKMYKGITYSYFKRIETQAKKRKISFSITIEYIGDLLEKQKNKCALTGIPLTLKKIARDSTQTASLDRKDNSKGYIEGNLQWVDKRINKLKSDFSQSEFIELCNKVIEFQLKTCCNY